MKRILYGMGFLGSLIMNIAMLITFGVLEFISYHYDKFNQEKIMAIYVLCVVTIMSITLGVLFIKSCKRENKRVKLRGIFKEFKDEVNGINTAYDIYIDLKTDKSTNDEMSKRDDK